jgi:hypothetical protein
VPLPGERFVARAIGKGDHDHQADEQQRGDDRAGARPARRQEPEPASGAMPLSSLTMGEISARLRGAEAAKLSSSAAYPAKWLGLAHAEGRVDLSR